VLQPTNGLNCDVIISANGYQAVRIPVGSLQPDAQNVVRVSLSPAAGDGTTTVPGSQTPPGTYRGVVTNGQTGAAIPMANVQITQRTTGASATVLTNIDGAYIVALDPYNTYDLVITAPGYEIARFPITNNAGGDANVLGNMTLIANDTGGTTTGGGSGTYVQTQGYSVQLASLAKQPDLSKFSNITSLGRVYDVNTGSAYKVRLGVFATRAEAAAAAASVKGQGYSGAFVVADSGSSAFPQAGGSTTYTPPTTTTGGNFKVQIGAYGKPGNFDRNKAAQLGSIETTSRGTLTLFMVGGLYTLDDARRVQAQAKSMGYTGAFVLEQVNGQLVKLK
jgi:hypothetical protein